MTMSDVPAGAAAGGDGGPHSRRLFPNKNSFWKRVSYPAEIKK
jgi:hypothetical protein